MQYEGTNKRKDAASHPYLTNIRTLFVHDTLQIGNMKLLVAVFKLLGTFWVFSTISFCLRFGLGGFCSLSFGLGGLRSLCGRIILKSPILDDFL